MKSTKSKNKILDNAYLEEEFFEDVKLIGIVSASEYYMLVSYINQGLGFQFKKNHELEIQLNDIFYPAFEFIDHTKFIEHYIFCNRRKTNFMMPDAKNIDYFWMMKGSIHYQPAIKELPAYLKKVKGVDYCFELNSENLKSRQLLII